MDRLLNYLRDTRAELQHVTWPTQRQAVIFTVLVIAISIIVSLFLGLFDYIFQSGNNWLINS